MRPIALVVLVSAVVLFVTEAMAQGRSDPRCSAGWRERCVSACIARGGQTRLCPTYCERSHRDRCQLR